MTINCDLDPFDLFRTLVHWNWLKVRLTLRLGRKHQREDGFADERQYEQATNSDKEKAANFLKPASGRNFRCGAG